MMLIAVVFLPLFYFSQLTLWYAFIQKLKNYFYGYA